MSHLAGMHQDESSDEGPDEPSAGGSDHAMHEDDSLQSFEGHGGTCRVFTASWHMHAGLN
jgi:hypothetical protein